MIGQRLGVYEIVELIGKGGMATVYRAFQPNVGRYVAVKVIHASIAGDDVSLERFQREARLVARLEHPHILPLYDFDGIHEPPYIVMRYLESGTLGDVLERGRLPLGEVVYMMNQICSALDYAHRNGVVHRDIKPNNIMVDSDGNAFVTDFGIARIADRSGGLTQTGFAVGTPAYMSPEQALGESDVDSRSDVYSLGVMLYEIVIGQMPYNAETPMALLMRHIQHPVPDPRAIVEDIQPAIADVLMRALAKDRNERFQSATELSDAFANAVRQAGETQTTPAQMRRAAQSAIQRLQVDRQERSDELQATMQQFEVQRDQMRADPTVPSRDGMTVRMSTDSVKAWDSLPANATPRSGGVPIWAWGIGALILLALAAGLGVFFTNQSNTRATATSVALVGQQTESALQMTASDVALQTRNAQDRATDSAVASATDVAVQTRDARVLATQNAVSTATDSALQTQQASGNIQAGLDRTATDAAIQTVQANGSATAGARASATNDARQTERAALIVAAAISETPSPTATATVTLTPSPTIPLAFVQINTGARVGPGPNFPVIDTLRNGDILPIIAISEDTLWYQIQLADGRFGWITASPPFVNSAGNIAALEVAFAPTNTPTDTPTATATATFTVTPSPTVTATNTPSPTVTDTPTNTPTITPSPTATNTPTTTPSPTPNATNTPTMTPTPLPGRLPFIADFEEGSAEIADWDFDPTVWRVATEGGESLLIGQGRLEQPMVIVGRSEPEWLNDTTTDFLAGFKINLDPQSAGGRFVFRYTEDEGYYVLEVFPGVLILKRNAPTPNLFDRSTERVIAQNTRANILANEWYEVRLWAEGSRIFIYVNDVLVMTADDLITPVGAGQMLFQVNSSTRPVRFDDILIQRPEPASDHFESASFPNTWRTSDTVASTIQRESSGNQYLNMNRAVTVNPISQPLQDTRFTYRSYIQEGGYQLFLRESGAGVVRLDLIGGNLSVRQLDGAGNEISRFDTTNFYNRGRWEDVSVVFVGDRLRIFRDGVLRLDEELPATTPPGGIRFETSRLDILRLDDVLITETSVSRNEDARFAFELRGQVGARDFRLLRSDLDENFDDVFRTDDWWVDGANAAGEFTENLQSNAENQKYLTMTHSGRPTYRLFRDVIGVEMFRLGTDTTTFSNSTDLDVSVLVRFPEGQGGAYLATRASQSLTGSDLLGYRLVMVRRPDGTALFQVHQDARTSRTTLFEGELLGHEGELFNNWTTLEVVTYQDRAAFFVNGNFLYAVTGTQILGGTVAIGVEENTTAEFDTLLIRDTTPHGE
ncbi:MAG: protein kinase domain-containing protein [Phototrophicaceae bacterium]